MSATLACLAALALPAAASADTRTVNKTADTNDGQCNADCSLREAVAAAGTGDTVKLPASATPYLVSTNTITVAKTITIDGDGARTTTVSGNDAHRPFTIVSGGGAITVAISDLAISDGLGDDGPLVHVGGGIQVNPSTSAITTHLVRLHVHDNLASTATMGIAAAGGGLGIAESGSASSTVTVIDSTFTRNVASAVTGSYGGAISVSSDGASTLSVLNSTLSANEARITGGAGQAHGGGISLVEGLAGNVSLLLGQSTLAGNLANTGNSDSGSGGGSLHSIGPVSTSIAGSIISGGDAVGTATENCKNVVAAGDNIEDKDTCGVGAAGKPSTDPGLGPLQDNGGPTDTHAITAASPAADAALVASCSPFDQRGIARPKLDGCDMGAFEAWPPDATTGAAGSIGQTSAALAGSVTPNQQATTYRFEYGPTTAYDSSTPVVDAGNGAGAVGAAASLSGLAPGTTYHYRVAATSASGTTVGADATFTTTAPAVPPVPPVARLAIASLRLAPTAFRAAASGPSARDAAVATGTTVSYRLSAPATTRFAVERRAAGRRVGRRCVKPTRANRRRRACVRHVTLRGSISRRSAAAGAQRFRFTGRLRGRRLAPGRYRLVAIATSPAGARSPVKRVAFRILRPARKRR